MAHIMTGLEKLRAPAPMPPDRGREANRASGQGCRVRATGAPSRTVEHQADRPASLHLRRASNKSFAGSGSDVPHGPGCGRAALEHPVHGRAADAEQFGELGDRLLLAGVKRSEPPGAPSYGGNVDTAKRRIPPHVTDSRPRPAGGTLIDYARCSTAAQDLTAQQDALRNAAHRVTRVMDRGSELKPDAAVLELLGDRARVGHRAGRAGRAWGPRACRRLAPQPAPYRARAARGCGP